MRQNIAIFASGTGTNAANIIHKFENTQISVCLVVTNNPDSGVIKIAFENKIPCIVIGNNIERYSELLIENLKYFQINLIVLAGFLRKIPSKIISKYNKKIINIHPALLPKYGGKGMYGSIIHRQVKENKDRTTGITIHYVNEKYDEGEIIFQKEILVKESDSLAVIEKKIHELEYRHFPEVIINLLNQ